MAARIRGDRTLTVTTEPQDVGICFQDFLMVNQSTSGTVFFREKGKDGEDASKTKGFALWPGEMLPCPITADLLSMVSDSGTVDVRLLFLD